ncbi:hypothetical protein PoB_007144400 [Plakobranchus ocellatus]|uniref:Pre-rRNA-processing protein TSR2 homolog n=1 Tax=Plakobranchus ocellatus TaxID=259542 RepID=A0AAV4DLL7_9GAST|nr:hypothetical protein PoB_007144400 [Plakobranchus ocellatus]
MLMMLIIVVVVVSQEEKEQINNDSDVDDDDGDVMRTMTMKMAMTETMITYSSVSNNEEPSEDEARVAGSDQSSSTPAQVVQGESVVQCVVHEIYGSEKRENLHEILKDWFHSQEDAHDKDLVQDFLDLVIEILLQPPKSNSSGVSMDMVSKVDTELTRLTSQRTTGGQRCRQSSCVVTDKGV